MIERREREGVGGMETDISDRDSHTQSELGSEYEENFFFGGGEGE